MKLVYYILTAVLGILLIVPLTLLSFCILLDSKYLKWLVGIVLVITTILSIPAGIVFAIRLLFEDSKETYYAKHSSYKGVTND